MEIRPHSEPEKVTVVVEDSEEQYLVGAALASGGGFLADRIGFRHAMEAFGYIQPNEQFPREFYLTRNQLGKVASEAINNTVMNTQNKEFKVASERAVTAILEFTGSAGSQT